MSFGFYERLSLHLTLAVGVLLIAVTREISPLFWAPVLGAVGVNWVQQAGGSKAWIVSATLPTLLAVAFAGLDWIFIAPNYLVAIVDLILVLLGLKLLGPRRVADNLQMLGLSFLLVLGASVITVDAVFGILLLVYMFAGLSAMVLQNLRGHWENAGGETALLTNRRGVLGGAFGVAILVLGCGILAFTLVLYFTFPRVGLRWWRGGAGYTSAVGGFSVNVNLNDVGRIKLNPAIALRVWFPGGLPAEEDALRRLRGVILDSFDGTQWSASQTRASEAAIRVDMTSWRLGPGRFDATLRIMPDSSYASVLFLPAGALQVAGDFTNVYRRPQGYYHADRRSQGRLTYEVMASASTTPENVAKPAAIDFELPAGLSPRVSALAATWAAGATGAQMAARLVAHLRREYQYTTELADTSGSPLEHFLFQSRTGHCELYATALAVMLRTQGIAARVVNGFVEGEAWDEDSLVYREMNAHSWVLAFLPGQGWTELDPTPAVAAPRLDWNQRLLRAYYDAEATVRFFWGTWFVDYDLNAQARLADDFRLASDRIGGRLNVRDVRRALRQNAWLAAFVAAGLVVGGGLWSLARRRKKYLSDSRLTRLYRSRLKKAEKTRKRLVGETPLHYARELACAESRWGAFPAYTELYYRLRFGTGQPADGARFLELHDQLGRVNVRLK